MGIRTGVLMVGVVGGLICGEVTAADGKAVYEKGCRVCHTSGLAGAPKFADKAAWKDRIATGLANLEKNAINGMEGYSGKMPARGGNPKLTDDDVKAAVAYMVNAAK